MILTRSLDPMYGENTSLLSKIRMNSETIRALVDENDDMILRLYAEMTRTQKLEEDLKQQAKQVKLLPLSTTHTSLASSLTFSTALTSCLTSLATFLAHQDPKDKEATGKEGPGKEVPDKAAGAEKKVKL